MSVSPHLLSRALIDAWADRLQHRLNGPLPLIRNALAEALGFPSWLALSQALDERSPPIHTVLPPLATAKLWAKRLAKALTRQGHRVALTDAQAAWAHAFGLSRWTGVPALLGQAERLRVSEQLFGPTGWLGPNVEHRFRYLAIEEDPTGKQDVIVHYAVAEPVWERQGWKEDPADFLRERLTSSAYAQMRVGLQRHDYLRDGWPLPWGNTVKADTDNFPVLLVRTRDDGRVDGVLMRDSHHRGTLRWMADRHAESNEVDLLLRTLRAAPVHHAFHGWYKDRNLEGQDLAELIAQTPETEQGQKHVVVYHDHEWHHGFWNNPATAEHNPGLVLSSIADFYGTRVAHTKAQTRQGLDSICDRFTLHGDYALLDAAASAFVAAQGDFEGDLEQAAPIRPLCDWWNRATSVGPAGFFRLYVWNEASHIFVAGDADEPAIQAADMDDLSSWALFEAPGRHPVALCFCRGKAFNTVSEDDPNRTQTYLADGSPSYEIGLPLAEVDEAHCALRGLDYFSGLDYLGLARW